MGLTGAAWQQEEDIWGEIRIKIKIKEVFSCKSLCKKIKGAGG